ncbi:hypothetical protein ccrud_01930 [Corynebacterium crudilactis]|uniref:Acyltransferase 3 domain-containing protein n=1 Tax=Corynebacterium crudilactis TaxID=1652495 RepID=A0A172QQY8_9CORY|nr:hypothetical protein ccrud_01930 [Corynebacterium crudilactis]
MFSTVPDQIYSVAVHTTSKTSSLNIANRLDWVDAIKGATILLVVAGHATNFAMPYHWYGSIPDDIMSAFRSFRMPLFFMLSGFFFLRRVEKPWFWWIKNRAYMPKVVSGGVSGWGV